MHDELLKLEGHLSSSGGKLSFISTAGDDGWEIVGPKNRSAVTRTQSILPSKLSAIFGGQLISVVKAQGWSIFQVIYFYVRLLVFWVELYLCAFQWQNQNLF